MRFGVLVRFGVLGRFGVLVRFGLSTYYRRNSSKQFIELLNSDSDK